MDGRVSPPTNSSFGGQIEINFDVNETILNCTNEEGLPLLISMTTANIIRYAQIVFYLTSFPIGVFLNSFLVVVIVRFKQLHSITFFLALQIIIVDLLNVIIFFPTSTANAIAGHFVFKGLCSALGSIISFLFASRNLLMLVLVADRFSLVHFPFKYLRHRVNITLSLSIAAWLLSLTHVILPWFSFLECYQFERYTWTCLISEGCRNPAPCSAYRTIFLTLFTGGIFVSFLLYVALMCKARQIQNRVAVMGTNTAIDGERQKRSLKIERRAHRTFLLMSLGLVGVMLPSYMYFVGGLIIFRVILQVDLPETFFVGAVIMLSIYYLIFITDPIIMLRNQDVRQVMNGIVGNIRRKWRNVQTN